MKRWLIIFLVLVGCEPFDLGAATYYVSTTGNNANAGTITSPFATINRAWTAVANNSDDIIYVRGGTYTYAMLGTTTLSGKDGIGVGQRISVFNYPGEIPIIDFLDYSGSSATEIIRIENCDYVHIKGLELRHNVQPVSGRLGYGLRVSYRVNNCIFENMNIHHCGGWGVVIYGGSNVDGYQSNNNLYYRIDSHHHSDRYSAGSGAWGGSDGFLLNSYNGYTYPSMGTVFRQCRAYWNSDDGWDNRLFNGNAIYDECWAFWNGYQPGYTSSDPDVEVQGGNGYGFKLGSRYAAHTATVMREMYNCIAFENRETGIQMEHSDGAYDMSSELYNNTAYGNGRAGFSCGAISVGTTWLRNNLSYANGYDIASDDPSIDDEYNASGSSYWRRRDFIPASTDFANLNSTGMDGARGEEGELPILEFLHLNPFGSMVDVGTDVGLSYEGSAPDIGAYEYGEEEEIPPTDPEVTGLVKYFYNNKWVFVTTRDTLVIKR